MTRDEVIGALESYESELAAILSRFSKSREGIHINATDHPRFKEIVIQVRDLMVDEFVESERHTQPLISYFNDAISTYTGSPFFRGGG
jgi:hypothetical protein